MSNANPLTRQKRRYRYKKQNNGAKTLTPAQTRRLRKKSNQAKARSKKK